MSLDLKSNWEDRAQACADLWQLRDIEWRDQVSTAHVGYCGSKFGPAVLKVSIAPGMVGDEAATLNHFGWKICPKVFAFDKGLDAILLERIYVVEDLSTLYPDPEGELDVWLPIYHEVVSRRNYPGGFPTLQKFAEVFGTVLGLELPSDIRRLMRYAHDRSEILMGSDDENRLLHGDMHHFNVLRDKSGGWRLIDPHGVIGYPLYELGAFLRNPWDTCYTEPGVQDRLADRVAVLADRLSIPASVVAEYGFFGAAISVAWSLEEGSDDDDGMVVMSEACLRLVG